MAKYHRFKGSELVFVYAWNLTMCGGCAWLVWNGWNPWWFVLAVLLMWRPAKIDDYEDDL